MTIFSCTNPPANISLPQVFQCVGEMTFGSLELASIAFFIIVMWLMWQLRFPKEVSLPIGIGLLIVMLIWNGGGAILSLLILAFCLTAILIIFGFLNLLQR